jgi:hypothetical protein
MKHGTKFLSLAVILAATAMTTLTGCGDDEPTSTSKAGTFKGPTMVVGKGTAYSWVKLDDAGNPTSIGISLTDSALVDLSQNPFPPQMFNVALPSQASATAFNHIGLDWNAMGHPPDPIYTLPHFDIHFYMIDTATKNAISPLDSVAGRATPDTAMVPTGYTGGPTPHEIIPGMGIHYFDPASHEFHGSAFTSTLIYGFWKGKMIFIEPMITRAYLQSKVTYEANLALPTVYPTAGKYYPTKYKLTYDAAAGEHVVSLDGMVKR